MPTRYLTLPERLEARRKAAIDLLGAFLLALCVFLPVCLWFTGVLP